MEAHLRKVQRRLGEGGAFVHVVLGGPEPDVDTVAATLSLSLHLSQKEPPGEVCVPVLSRRWRGAALPQETVGYLQRLKICEDWLVWREDVDLIELHHARRLSLTLLREGLLQSSEYHTLEASIQRVVHHDGQQDAADDGPSAALTTVTRELLQEAAEHIRAALWETLGEALQLQSEAFRRKRGHGPAQLEELWESLEQWRATPAGPHGHTEPQALEQLLRVELKEFSDGETTVALTSVTTDVEDWYDHVKSFGEQHDYDGLVVLLSITAEHRPSDQQVAVFSNDTDLLNQICCELEESSSWCLSGPLEARAGLQVYYIPLNTPASYGSPPPLVEEIEDLLKVFVNRRSSVSACHPSSRTSSTEGVAGSVEFSQGSSGINDMDGSDMERPEGGAGDTAAVPNRVVAEDDTGDGGAGTAAELVSPDSGMTTIRSSRSSKASSVFLSDDSPVGDATAGGAATGLSVRNLSSVVSSSLSPPVPPERMKHRHNRNKSDHLDLLSLDPLHGDNDSVSKKETSCQSGGGKRAESSSFSELEELNLVDFSGFSVVGRLERGTSLPDHHDGIPRKDVMDTMVPPTPVNSVVGSRPPSSCGVRFFPEDVVERINSLQHKDSMSSSLSETWDELDTQGASTSSDSALWNRTVDAESPLNIMEELSEKRNEEESFHSRGRFQTLEPQLSLIIEPAELYDRWNPDSLVKDQWNSVTLSCLQLTPPEEEEVEETGKRRAGVTGGKEKASSLLRKKAVFTTLTPDTSREEDEGTQGKKGDRQMELLDFWTYSAQKGFLKSDSGTTTSYPESLDMWNMTIRDDSLSPLTTPDNISENSGSFCRSSPTAGAEAGVESPLGFTDSGMAMWNTTIRDDSSSALTTPEASENRNLVDMAALEAGASPEAHESGVAEGERAREEDRDTHRGSDQTAGKAEPDYRVKIVIEAVEDKTLDEDDDAAHVQNWQNLASGLPEGLGGADTSQPVPGMVTSASEYDNVGASGWSLASSPEACASPVTGMIHLEEQSSPFVAVTTPHQIDEEHRQYQQNHYFGKTAPAAGRQQESQVFRFGRTGESGSTSRASSVESKYDNRSGERSEEEADWNEPPTNHSPFLLVDIPVITQDTSAHRPPRDFQIAISHRGNGSVPDLQGKYTGRSREDVTAEASPPHRSLSGAEPETLRCSRDSLHPGSQDDLRSSSDGDSSGLEMEYIIVSGTVKEAGREPCSRHQRRHRQSDQTRNPAEMFSTLSYAARVLQDQVRAARSDQENLGSSASGHQMTGMIIHNHPKSHSSQPQAEDGNCDGSSGSLSSSLSPSLRYPSDHFLKAREEVYVHSQISMEDSDEGGQSPSAPPPCSTSLGDMQTWKETPQSTSEPQSPTFTHSSPSHTSSSGSPLGESRVSIDRDLGLPFSGDLMEEKNNEVEHEEDIISAHNVLTRWTAEPQRGTEERQRAGSPPLFCFTEELNGGSLLPQREEFQQEAADRRDGQLDSFVHVQEKWSTKQPISDGEASEVSYPFDSRHGVQFSTQSANHDAASQWTGDGSATQGQTQYGYNYHHIDQRTENQGASSACVDPNPTKATYQSSGSDVYAEFTTNASVVQYGSEQAEHCYKSGRPADYILGDPGSRCDYMSGGQYEDPNCRYTSEPVLSQDQANVQSQYELNRTQHQLDGHMCKLHVHPEREAHPQYRPEEYVDLLPQRQCQQGESSLGMKVIMKNVSSEEDAEQMDNRSDWPAGSQQNTKWFSPPVDVSLEQSEGSVLSEDALDTEDDGLDTGDDLEVSTDELDTPEEADLPGGSEEPNPGAGVEPAEAEENGDGGMWRSVTVAEQEHRIDMKSIEPYKRVISHGGYYTERNAIIVFSACFLPDSNCHNYSYVMENLFLYVINTLELMVAEDYMIVYLNGATPRRRLPGFTWMKKCYQMIDRRLKKNLKMFIIVHPSWFIRTLLGITRPFISTKFSSKIKYVNSLQELGQIIPLEYVNIPASIVRVDKKNSLL